MNSTGGIQIRLGDLIYGILKRWKMILVLTFIGLVFGVLISAFTYMQGSYSNYQIDASFVILTRDSKDNFTSYGTTYPHPDDYDFAAELVEAVNYVIKSDANMTRAIDSMRIIGIKPQDISQNLTLTAYSSTSIVEATFTWRDAKEGVQILNAVLEATQETLPETLKVGELSIIDKPAARQSLTGTIGGSVWGYMTILGFLAGVGYVVLELLMRPTLTNLSDMENVLGLESLGVIPQDKKYFRNKKSLLVDDDVTSSAVIQNYASTAFIMRNRFSSSPPPHCFYVTSTITGEGKSTVSANLAVQLSDMEFKVLLIDMDSHNPTLGKLFLDRVDHDRCLNALYRGDATIEESIYTLTGYLDLLPMVMDRQPIPMEGTIIDLIRELEKRYDYVIIDTAAVGQYSEVLSLNAIADTVLFVVGYDAATIPEIQNAVEKLDKSGIRLIGSIVNNVQNLTAVPRNDETEERKLHLRRSKDSEPLIWEKALSGRNKQDDSSMDSVKGAVNKQKTRSGDGDEAGRSRRRRYRNNAEKGKKARDKQKKNKLKRDKTKPDPENKANLQGTDEGQGISTEHAKHRDPLMDIMEDEKISGIKHTISDNDARDALFRIGMEGDFESGTENEGLVLDPDIVLEELVIPGTRDEVSTDPGSTEEEGQVSPDTAGEEGLTEPDTAEEEEVDDQESSVEGTDAPDTTEEVDVDDQDPLVEGTDEPDTTEDVDVDDQDSSVEGTDDPDTTEEEVVDDQDSVEEGQVSPEAYEIEDSDDFSDGQKPEEEKDS